MNTLNLIKQSLPLWIGALCFMSCSDELASSDRIESQGHATQLIASFEDAQDITTTLGTNGAIFNIDYVHIYDLVAE